MSSLIDLPGRAIRNAASSYLGFAAEATTALLLIPFLVHRLGSERFGLWVLLTSLLGLLQLLELGLMPAVVRYVAHHRARGEQEAVEGTVAAALLVVLALACLTLPLVAAAGWLLPSAFHLEAGERALFHRGVWLVGAAGVLASFRRLFTAVLVGHQRFGLLNLCTASGCILGALASVAVIGWGHGVLGLLGVAIGQLAYEGAFQLVVVRRVLRLHSDPRRSRREDLRKLGSYSGYSFLIDLSLGVSHRLDAFVIGVFLPAAAVTSFSLGQRLAAMIESLTEPLVETFFPLAAELDGGERRDGLGRLLVSGTALSLLLVSPALVLAAWHGGDLLAWWVGPEHVAASLPVLRVFLAVVFFAVMEATAARILLGMGLVRFDAAVCLGSALLNLVLSLALVEDLGIVGVALGTLVPAFAGKVLVSIPYTCARTGTPLLRFLLAAVAPAVVASALTLAMLAATGGWIASRGGRPAAFAVHALLAGLVTLAVLVAQRPRSRPAPASPAGGDRLS